MPEIFDCGISCVVRRAVCRVVRRAVIIGNGAAGAEHQCIGLVRALGLSYTYPVHQLFYLSQFLQFLKESKSSQRGHIIIYLRWLPVPIHKQLDCLLRQIHSDWRRLPLPGFLNRFLGYAGPSSLDSRPPRGEYGLRALTLDDKPIPEADAGCIAALAQEDVDRDGLLLVVASSWDTVLVAAAVKKLAPKATFVVQIQLGACVYQFVEWSWELPFLSYDYKLSFTDSVKGRCRRCQAVSSLGFWNCSNDNSCNIG